MENNKHIKTAIVIAGPTAVGKTTTSIRLAQHFNAEILSTDSRQCFKEMQIGTAVPTREELQTIPHHFIHSHSIHEEMNVGLYEKYAIEKAEEIFSKKDVLVTCGGTGLYINAFCKGIDKVPAVSNAIKKQIKADYQQKGIGWLQQTLQQKDSEGFLELEKENPQRLMRALGVLETTGYPISKYQTGQSKKRPFHIIKIGLTLPKEDLWKNIKKRIEEMVSEGLEKEAKPLYPFRHLNALQTTGYQEIFNFMDGKYSFEEALEQIYIHTRQYAKRQMTWFRKDKDFQWFSPNELEDIIRYTEKKIHKAIKK